MAVNWDEFKPVGGTAAATDSGEVDWAQFKPAPAKPGLIRSLADVALEIPAGAANATKALADAFGAGSEVSRSLGNTAEMYQGMQSPARQAERQAQAQRSLAAEQSGSTWEEVKAAGQNFFESPVSASAGAAGSLVPIVAGGLIASRLGVKPTAATGALSGGMGAGAVKGSIYDDQLKRAQEAGLSPEQAQAKATAAQAYSGQNTDQIALGAGLGVLAGSTGVERVLGGATSGIKSLIGRIGAGAVQEALPEAAQGGQERLAANIAAQREGYDAPTWQGVAGQATTEGLASAAPGSLSGGMTRYVDPAAGPLSRAAATAQQTGAAGLAQAAQQAQAAEGDTQAAQPDSDPLAGLSARLTPEAMRAVRTAEGYGPESVNEVLRAYQIARNPELDPTIRQQATEALNGFWQGFDNRPNWTRPNPQPEQAPQPGTDVVPFGQGTDVAAPGVAPPFDPNTLDGEAQEVGTLPPNRPLLTGPEEVAQQYRRDLLEEVLADPDTRNPLSRYESVLKKNGFEQRRATPDERKLIEDRTVYRTETVPARAELPPFAAVEQSRRAAFPMTQTGAQRQAAERTQATGQAFEVVPHPTVKGRFAVQAAGDATLTNEGAIRPADQFRDATQMVAPVAAANTSPERVTETPEIEQVALADQNPIKNESSAVAGIQAGAGEIGAQQSRIEPTNSLSRTASWVIRDKATGEAVMETFDRKKVDALNTDKYEAVPIQEHLASLNRQPTNALLNSGEIGTQGDPVRGTETPEALPQQAQRGTAQQAEVTNAPPAPQDFDSPAAYHRAAREWRAQHGERAKPQESAQESPVAAIDRKIASAEKRLADNEQKRITQPLIPPPIISDASAVIRREIDKLKRQRQDATQGVTNGPQTDPTEGVARAPEPAQTLPQAGQASRPQGVQEGAQEPGSGVAAKAPKPGLVAPANSKDAVKRLRRYFEATKEDQGPYVTVQEYGKEARIEALGRSHTNYSKARMDARLTDGRWEVSPLHDAPTNEIEREYQDAIRAAVEWMNTTVKSAKAKKEAVAAPIQAEQSRSDLDTVAERVTEPTHADPGKAPEAATAPVIREAIQKSARNTEFNAKEAKTWLLAEIDRAIADAPADGVMEGVTITGPVTNRGKKEWTATRDIDVQGTTLSARLAIRQADGGFVVGERFGTTVYARSPNLELASEDAARLLHSAEWKTGTKANGAFVFDTKALEQKEFVTFDVPGDGTFRVVNALRNLQAFRDKVETSPGFRANPVVKPNFGTGTAQGPSLEQSIADARKFGTTDDALQEIGNAIEIARLKKAKDEDKLLDRFREASNGKDYDAWRAEQDAEEEATRREEGDRQAKAEQDAAEGEAAFAKLYGAEMAELDAQAFPTTREKIGEAYGAANGAIYGKLWSSSSDRTHKDRLTARLKDAGLKEREAKRLLERAATIHAENTRGASSMTFLRLNEIQQAAEDLGFVAAREAGQSATPNSPEPRAEQGQQADTGADTAVRDVSAAEQQPPAEASETSGSRPAESVAQAAPTGSAKLEGSRRDPTKVSAFMPYEDGDIVRLADGKEWQVRQDMGGWYLTSTGNWRGTHPTIQKVRAMNDLIREVEQAAQAQPIQRSFAGESARTADTHALASAQSRIQAGEDAETVRQETGWFRGADNRWRFEIDDSDAKLKPKFWTLRLAAMQGDTKQSYALATVLDHPKLFAAYPFLRQERVFITPDEKVGGRYDATGGDGFGIVEISTAAMDDADKALSIMLHEIQHGIQDKEGFAVGGSPDAFAAEGFAARDRANAAISEINAQLKDAAGTPRYAELLEARSQYVRAAQADSVDILDAANKKYRALAGEVESRNTQARQKLTAAERRATSPESTADVKASDVIVVFNGTEMASAPAPANAAPMQSTGTTLDAIWSAVESLVGPLRRRRIVVVQSADVLVEQGILQSRDANGAQAFVKDGKAYFIAGNIQPGNERAVFLHEVGAHLGMEKILSPFTRNVLLNRIKTWAAQANGSVESRIAQAAQRRVEAAGGQDADLETVAYFVEEAVKAGINPTTDTAGPIGQWFKTLWAALRTALEKLGLVNASKLTAQDVVNLAHGAANVAMSEDATGGELQLSRADQIDSPAFKRWFGDSKVVDEQGRPLVVYHGTKADISEFSPSASDTNNMGMYFTALPDYASQYARSTYRHKDNGSNEGANVLPVYLSVQNPLVIEKFDDGGVWQRFRDAIFKAAAQKRRDEWNEQRMSSMYVSRQRIQELREQGYDGIINKAANEIVVFDPTQVKSATGNSGNFSPSDPRIQFSRAEMPDWLNQMPQATQEAARKAGIWQPHKPLKERLKDIRATALKRVQQGLVDQFAPLKELGDREYVLARLTKSSDAPLEALLLYGKPFLNDAGAIDVNLEKGGLIGGLQKLEGEHDRFFAWMAGNRAEQLKAEGRENLFTDTDITALKDLNQGNMPDGSSRAAKYNAAKLQFSAYSKAVLDIAEKAGIIAAEDRAIWEKDFYVPFYRAMEDGEYKGPRNASGLVNQYAFKKLKGGTDNLNDLMQNTLRNWSHLLSASLKNQAAAAALESAEAAGVATPISQKQKGSVSFLGRVKRKIPAGQSYVENGVTLVSDGTAEIETIGEKHYMVDDPFILNAITSLEFAGWNNPAMKMMQKAKHYLTLGVTISPTFKIRNLIRDQISAIGLNPMSYNLMSNLAQGWKGTDKDSAQYAKMLAGGGLMRFGTFLEDDRAEHMKRLIQAGVSPDTILNTKDKAKAMLGKAWDWWQDVGDRSENIARASIYQQRYDQFVKEGKTADEAHLLASFAARDSMDFSLQGQWGSIRFLTQLVPFLGARLQGLYKLGREGVAPSVRLLTGNAEMGDKERAMRFGAVAGTVALASMVLFLAYRDDDDWKEREEWDRDAYFWFKVGDTAFRIPKPFEIGAIGTIAERGLETALNGMDKESRRIFIARMWEMLMGTFAMNPVPQLFKPVIDLYANTDSFTGRPIETMGMERLSKAQRIGPGTSATAQLLGKATSLVGLSPVQVDHLIEGYFSWLGTHAVMTTDFALRPLMGLPDQPARKWPDGYFVLGDFAKDLPSNQSKYLTQFYEQSKKVQEAMADIRYYQSLGQTEKALELSQDNADKIRMYGLYTTAERQISGINKQIKAVQMSSATADVKREQIDRLTQARNQIAKAIESRRAAQQ